MEDSRARLLEIPGLCRLANLIVRRQPGDTLCLRGSRVQPGDVLLTGGMEKFSKWATILSAGPFSHASLMLAPHLQLEADSDGLGQTILEVVGMEKFAPGITDERGRTRGYLYELRGADAALLLRPINLIGLTRDAQWELEELIAILSTPFFGLEYPRYYELGSALPQGTPLRIFYELTKHIWKAARSPSPLEGPFCSAFVVEIFNRLRIPIFPSRKLPRNINPNTFLYGHFRAVDGAAVQVSDWQSEWYPDDLKDLNRELEALNKDQKSRYPTRQEQMDGNRLMLDAFHKLGRAPWHEADLDSDDAIRIEELAKALPNNVYKFRRHFLIRVMKQVQRFVCGLWYVMKSAWQAALATYRSSRRPSVG